MSETEAIEFPDCPIETIFSLIGHKWKILIIRDLLCGSKRFGELKKSTHASQKSLTTNLRELEDDGIIERKVFAQIPPKVEYSLTALGKEFHPVMEALQEWGQKYIAYTKKKE